jgi:hypothetical protein
MTGSFFNRYGGGAVILLWIVAFSGGYRLPNTVFRISIITSRLSKNDRNKPAHELSMSTTVVPIYGESDSERLKKAKLRLAEAQVKNYY